ncbi:MAG: response regulator transcription factor [Flavobacteriales bacterium]|nr:response regulator transcription factor [Flavobacteriales bacterium]MCB9449639.1 response regulator transcription factor [Flavobacteriales bacterium]
MSSLRCTIIDDNRMSQSMLKNYIGETDFLTLQDTFASGTEATKGLMNHPPDLIFLDIEMPDMTGIDLIRNLPNLPMIILVTSHKEYALEAFEYDVLDYLVKPVNYARFLKAVRKAVEKTEKQKNNNTQTQPGSDEIFVKSDGALVRIRKQDIFFVEAMGDYVNIQTVKNKYTVYSKLSEIADKLGPTDFFQTHRSFIARLDRIMAIDDFVAVMDGYNVPVSRSNKKELLGKLNLLK